MTKHITPILTLLGSLFLGLILLSSPVRSEAEGEHRHCVCGTGAVTGGEHTSHTEETWEEWTSTNSLPTATGFYYLTADVHLTGPQVAPAGSYIRLCLAGHKVIMDGNERVIRLGGASAKYLITNCGDREDGQLIGNCVFTSGAQGGVLWSNQSGGEYQLFNIVVDGRANKSGYGAAITTESNSNLKAWNTKILGGQTTNSSIAGGAVTAVGIVNLQNCELTGGSGAKGGVLWMKAQGPSVIENTVISGGSAANGGNVSLEGGEVLLNGCTVTGGNTTTGNGGNIFVTTGAVTIKDSLISGGTAAGHAGNIWLADGTLTVENSTIADGTSTGGNGGNVVASGTFTLKSGEIKNGAATGTNKFGGNITVASTGTVNIDGADAKVTGGTASFAGGIYVNGTLNLKNGTISGGTATRTQDGGGNVGIDGNGKFYMTGGTVSGGTADKGGNIFNYGLLSISGGTVRGGHVTNWAGNVAIYSSKDNVISGTAVIEAPDNFENVFINSGGSKLTMNGGIIRNSPWTNVRVWGQNERENGYFYFNGGEIYMDPAYTTGHNVRVWGSMEMNGGTIRDSKVAESGCNIRGCDASSRTAPAGITDKTKYEPYFKMTGGTISGGSGKNYGGNIYWHFGQMDISGGTITNGSITNLHGGNIFIDGGTANFTGGTVSYGASGQYGGNLAIDGAGATVTISDGCTFIGGSSNNGTGSTPNIYASKGTITITGGTFVNPDDKENALWYGSGMNVSVEGGYFTRIYGQKGATIEGGYLFEKPADSYLKEGFVFIRESETKTVAEMTKTFEFTVVPESEAVTVSLTSEAVLGQLVGASLTGGGVYRSGSPVNVTANVPSGYRFLGWYSGTEKLSSLPEAALTIGSGSTEVTCKAVYEYGAADGFSVMVEGTSNYTIEGTTIGTKYQAGKPVTVTYTGTGAFDGWTNDSGKLVSREAAYTFAAAGDTVLRANVTESGSSLVLFYSAGYQVIKTKALSDLTDADFSSVPEVTGKTNGRWTVNGTAVDSVSSLQSAAGSLTSVSVVAAYDNDDAAVYDLTVIGVEEGTSGTPDTWTAYAAGNQNFAGVNVSSTVTLNAPAGSKTFLYYANADGTVLSASAVTNVRYQTDTTIYAVYGDAAIAAAPAVTMITARRDGTTVYFEALRDLPDGYTLKEQGILFSLSEGIAYGKTGVYKYVSNGKEAHDVTGLTIKNAPANIYGIGYMIISDGANEGILYSAEVLVP